MLDRFKEGKAEAQFDTFLLNLMHTYGIPQEMLPDYRAVVLFEWDHQLWQLENGDYTSAINLFSLERKEAYEEQNTRLITIRKSMNTTENGKKSINEMTEKGVDDGFSTIPIPSISSFEPAKRIKNATIEAL
jgi:hypothetical protein